MSLAGRKVPYTRFALRKEEAHGQGSIYHRLARLRQTRQQHAGQGVGGKNQSGYGPNPGRNDANLDQGHFFGNGCSSSLKGIAGGVLGCRQ